MPFWRSFTEKQEENLEKRLKNARDGRPERAENGWGGVKYIGITRMREHIGVWIVKVGMGKLYAKRKRAILGLGSRNPCSIDIDTLRSMSRVDPSQ